MQIKVSGRHIDVTDAIRQYAEDKCEKLPRYFDRVQQIDVVIDGKDQNHHEVELKVEAEKVFQFVAKSAGRDLYACIDDTVDKMERQLTDHKDKLRNRKHNVS